MSYTQWGQPPYQPPIPAGPRRRWYAHPAAIALGLLLFPPFGIWAVWKSDAMTTKGKWALTVVGSFWCVILAVSAAHPNSPKDDGASSVAVVHESQSATATPTPSATTAPPTTPADSPGPTLSPTPSVSPSPLTRPTTAAPVVTKSVPAPPATTHRAAPRSTTAAPPADNSGDSSDILSPSGRHYAAGQYCPKADLGLTTHDAHGALIRCEMVSGRAHWRHV